MDKLKSRKLWITVAVIGLVAVSEALGAPIDDNALEAIVAMGLAWLGAQGLVDTAAAFSAGKKVAGAVDAVKEEIEDEGA